MKPYFDEYQFLHDTIDADSNNPLIYSAFWKCLTGEKLNYMPVYQSSMLKHEVMGNDLSILRSPLNKSPTSLDEIIGAIYLKLLGAELLELYDWRWHDTLHSPKWYRVLQAAIYCAGKGRNFFKEVGGVRDLHPMAYWVPWHIQYYAYKASNKRKIMPFRALMFYLWVVSVLVKKNYKVENKMHLVLEFFTGQLKIKDIIKTKQTGSISQKNICYLVLKDLGNPLHRLINHKRNFIEYFDDDGHPITQQLRQ